MTLAILVKLLACAFVIGQIVGRAMRDDTASREREVWDACLYPGHDTEGR